MKMACLLPLKDCHSLGFLSLSADTHVDMPKWKVNLITTNSYLL